MKETASGSAAPGPVWQALARGLRRDRLLVTAGLLVLLALSWLDLLRRAGVFSASRMAREMAMPQAAPWSVADAVMTAVMWAVMMTAMMLPSAAPMVLLYSTVLRQRGRRGPGAPAVWLFLLGYLALWTGFSLGATVVQWGLHTWLLLSPQASVTSPRLAGVTLIAAGLYQFTPLKRTCLAHCQSPLGFLTHHWREGGLGAFRMGTEHGVYCVGCCWTLMLLLFVGGVMNLVWIALLAAFVLVERVMARGMGLSRMAGAVLAAWGSYLVVL